MEPQPESPPPVQRPVWLVRLGAFIVDAVVLGVVGVALSAAARSQLLILGDYSVLIGLAIATTYFGYMTSDAGGGQTLGHRGFGLKVIDAHGNALSLPKSFGRGFVLALGYTVSSSTTTLDPFLLFSVPGSIISLTQVYLVIFNRADGRLVHDLLFGTAVHRVGATNYGQQPLKRVHRIVCAAIALAASGGVVWGLVNEDTTSTASTFLQKAMAQDDVAGASMKWQHASFTSGQGTSTSNNLLIQVRMKHDPAAAKDRASDLAQLALVEIDGAKSVDRIIVTLNSGVRLGIGSWSSIQSFAHTPQEWAANAR